MSVYRKNQKFYCARDDELAQTAGSKGLMRTHKSSMAPWAVWMGARPVENDFVASS